MDLIANLEDFNKLKNGHNSILNRQYGHVAIFEIQFFN